MTCCRGSARKDLGKSHIVLQGLAILIDRANVAVLYGKQRHFYPHFSCWMPREID
jgi:hypothetical protein